MKPVYRMALATLIIAALGFTGCARMPKSKNSAQLIQKYFHKYGKKYPTTVFGKSHVKEVEITGQQEIHKGLVAVESFVTLEDGTVQRINATIKRGPIAWKFLSWENATGPAPQ